MEILIIVILLIALFSFWVVSTRRRLTVMNENIPIINLINPNNLITDGFYALYYYNTFNRYIRDICCLGVFIIVCLFISFRALRREQYDYI